MRTSFLAALALLVAATLFPANALSPTQLQAITRPLANLPAAEWPAQAARAVAAAPARDQGATAVAVVNAVVPKHPAVAIAMVASISTTAPGTAAATAAAAARLAPDQAVAIALIAAKAAPAFAPKIATAVARVVPSSAAQIANAVMKDHPACATQIADAVVASVPLAAAEITRANPSLNQPARNFASSADVAIGGTFIIYRGTISGAPAPTAPPIPAPTPMSPYGGGCGGGPWRYVCP